MWLGYQGFRIVTPLQWGSESSEQRLKQQGSGHRRDPCLLVTVSPYPHLNQKMACLVRVPSCSEIYDANPSVARTFFFFFLPAEGSVFQAGLLESRPEDKDLHKYDLLREALGNTGREEGRN